MFPSGVVAPSLPVPVQKRLRIAVISSSQSFPISGSQREASVCLHQPRLSSLGFQPGLISENAIINQPFRSPVSSLVPRSVCPRRWIQKRADHLDWATYPSQNSRQSLGWETASAALGTCPRARTPPLPRHHHFCSLHLTLSLHSLRWFYLHELINPSLCRTFIHTLSLRWRLRFIQEAKLRIHGEGRLGKEPFVTGLKEQLPVRQSAAY